MKKNIVLSIFAIAFTCFGGGCVVKSESKSMGRTWIIPPGPQTKGVEHMAIEVKSLDHRGQEIVTQREIAINYDKKTYRIIGARSSAGEGLTKAVWRGTGPALVDGLLDIPSAALWGLSLEPDQTNLRINSGNRLSAQSEGGDVEQGAVQNSVNQSTNTVATASPVVTANGGKVGNVSSTSNSKGGNATGGRASSGSSSSSDASSRAGSSSNSNARNSNTIKNNNKQGQGQSQEASGYGGDASSGGGDGGGWLD